jgi:hypothetical protein
MEDCAIQYPMQLAMYMLSVQWIELGEVEHRDLRGKLDSRVDSFAVPGYLGRDEMEGR